MRLHPLTHHALLPVVVLACLVLAGCGGTSVAPAQGSAGTAAAAAGDDIGGDATDADRQDATGIHVTGAWDVTVRDPNGTVSSTTAFHNDLVSGGAETLAYLLGVPGTTLDDLNVIPSGSELCDAPEADQCRFVETREVDTQNNAAIHTISVEAPSDGSVERVLTRAKYDAEGQSRSFIFTDRVLDAPVTFVEGQTVDITVTLTFS